MSSFANDYLKKHASRIASMDVLQLIADISERKGKQAYYEDRAPELLKQLQNIATIQSTESSNRLEGIVVGNQRLKDLMEDRTEPQSRSENEVTGYRAVLNQIHASGADIPIRPGVILQLHRLLYSFSPGEGGKWKPQDNQITEQYPDGSERIRFTPTPAILTPDAMETVCNEYSVALQDQSPHRLIVMAAFILDFLCIHPFWDGNGRMSRLLTLLCLYHGGYNVGRYISLEKIVEDTKEQYYQALYDSSQGWHQAQHDLLPWLRYFLGVVLRAYRDLEDRAALVRHTRGEKSARIREIVSGFVGAFSVRDLEERCPDIARPTINAALKQLHQEGVIERKGAGRATQWKRR